MKHFKVIFVVLSIVSILACSVLPCFATSYSTYSDVLQNNSTVNNLLSLRSDKQKDLNYVAFRSNSNEYLLVMSDSFQKSGKVLSANSVDIIFYNSDYGSDSTRYFSTQQSNFSLTINHVVVSDFLDFSSKNETSNWQQYILIVCCLILAFVIFNLLRRFK